MKHLMKSLMVITLITISAFVTQQPSLMGKWKTSGPDGSIVYVDFKTDSTFTNYTAAGETIHAGKYKVVDDVLFISDPDCGEDVWGKYKLTFTGEDSVSLKLFEDDCYGRAQQADGTALARVK